jgi:hypothetical protein
VFDPVFSSRIIGFGVKLIRQGAKSSLALALLQHLRSESPEPWW